MWIVVRDAGRYGYMTYHESMNDINRIDIKWNGLFYVKK